MASSSASDSTPIPTPSTPTINESKNPSSASPIQLSSNVTKRSVSTSFLSTLYHQTLKLSSSFLHTDSPANWWRWWYVLCDQGCVAPGWEMTRNWYLFGGLVLCDLRCQLLLVSLPFQWAMISRGGLVRSPVHRALYAFRSSGLSLSHDKDLMVCTW